MIDINLLPAEFRTEEIKRAKFLRIQTLGMSVILLMIFLTSLTLALRILQSQRISQIQANLTQSEQKISSLKTTQASLLLLKDRLTTISQYLEIPSRQSQSYTLITQLFPSGVSINSISVDNAAEATILALAPDSSTLDSLITNLTQKDINQDKISRIEFESINRGIQGFYRLNLRVRTKL